MIYLLVLIAGFLLYAALIAYLLPKGVRILRAAGHVRQDRGVRRANTPLGSLIVCEPSPAARGALEQYVLRRHGEEVVLLCKWKEHVAYAEYDLYLYDRRGKTVDVFKIKERVTAGMGERHGLPAEVCSVSPEITAVNGERTPLRRGNPLRRLLACGAFTAFFSALTVLWALFAELSFSHLLGEEGQGFPAGTAGFAIGMFFFAAAVYAVAVFALFWGKELLRGAGQRRGVRLPLSFLVPVGNFFLRVGNFFRGIPYSKPCLALAAKCRRMYYAFRDKRAEKQGGGEA